MRFRRFHELEDYQPSGHHRVVNRLLVGESNGDDGRVSVWHGTLEPGGHSDLHVHEASVQIYVGLSGEMVVGDGQREQILDHLATVVFQEGSAHFIANRSGADAEVLVISVPGLR